MAADIRDCGGNPLAHLTCVNAGREEMDGILDALADRGVENILALRGDLPEGGIKEDNFRYASQLVERIRRHGGFSVGAACYPEGHVECENQEQDLINLRRRCSLTTISFIVFCIRRLQKAFIRRSLRA